MHCVCTLSHPWPRKKFIDIMFIYWRKCRVIAVLISHSIHLIALHSTPYYVLSVLSILQSFMKLVMHQTFCRLLHAFPQVEKFKIERKPFEQNFGTHFETNGFYFHEPIFNAKISTSPLNFKTIPVQPNAQKKRS